ncbi:hypothetical protein BCV69DRAFT_284706 [Microstroma glucosiphilum]|uniref:AN1-type domain-containing protein n=1 Tax=Pseudomicrostroma glucosiphilum TaxID=1684307 RepID=A0A316U1J7_9BASI|nr:hypothetical protein BCV69DRAFT_284706 [Pseudomicrostroma glucosiphilum]PWN18724.1 hypothetical protein BCV69DRAFT_284706 [Pseudomicrostroma glucosiphilum]
MAPSPSPFASASPLNLPSSATRASSSRHDPSSSSSSIPALPSHETHMLFLGQACHLSSCRREDFLPFHCASCGHDYCSAHRLPHPGSEQGGHSCDFHLQPEKASSGEQGDFLVPLCPLCREPPKGWKRGEDPNLALDRHLSSGDCPELVGEAGATQSRRIKKANECNYKRCHKIMIVKMDCEKCRESFCPSHRAPAQHQCGVSPARTPDRRQDGQAPTASSTISGGLAALKRLKLGGASEAAAPAKNSGNQHQASSEPTPRSHIPTASNNDTSKNNASSNSQSIGTGNIFGLNLSASSAGRKVDKWVPPPIFGQA